MEYVVLTALISMSMLTVVATSGGALSNVFGGIADKIGEVLPGASSTTTTPPDGVYLTKPWLPPSWVDTPSGDSSLGKPGLEGSGLSGLAGSPLTSVVCAGANPTASTTVVGDVPSTPGIGDAWKTDSVALVPDSCQFTMHWTRFFDYLGGEKSPSINSSFGMALCRDNTSVALRRISDTADDSTGLTGSTVYDYGHSAFTGSTPCAGNGGIVAVGSAGSYSSPVRWQMRWLYLSGVIAKVTCRDAWTGVDTVQTLAGAGTNAVVQATCPDGSYPIRLVVISTPSGDTVLDTRIGSAEVAYWLTLSSMFSEVQISEDPVSGQCALSMPDGSQVQLQASDCSEARSEGILT